LARLRKAEAPHKRKLWRMQRENEATVGMMIEEIEGGFQITGPNDMHVGPFATNAEAWSWLDRNVPARRYGASRA
jgi:hypothetical protein